MTRVLFDVNVVLDFVLDRAPYSDAATRLWAAAERKEMEALIPAHGVTTVFYLAARQRNVAFARRVVGDLLVVPAVAPVDGPILRRAFTLGWSDFEAAVCAAAAEAAACDLLVTRDPSGFRDCPVLVVDPVTALAIVGDGSPDRVAEGTATQGKPRRRRPRP